MTFDDPQVVILTAGQLVRLHAFRGAATILFNAALQRQAADRRDLTQWTPAGAVPLRVRQPAEHPHAANDHAGRSLDTA